MLVAIIKFTTMQQLINLALQQPMSASIAFSMHSLVLMHAMHSLVIEKRIAS